MLDASWTNLANPTSWSYRDIIGQPLDALPRRVTRAVSASANVNGLDDLILVSGNSTLTLESAVGCDGRRHTFFKNDSSATTMTIACTGSETIDGSATLSTVVQYAGFDVFSDGTNWHAQRVGIDMLSFQQAGTGALVRTALAKMREWISLKDFAVGDGSTNDTTAINNWLTAIAGKTGYIPDGTYMTNGGHSIPSNTAIMGAGKRVAVLKLRSGVSINTRMFVNSDTSSGNSGITMRDVTLDGNRSANSAVTGLDAFVGQKVTFSQFLNMRVTGFTHHCFDFSVSNSDNLWQGCELDDYGTGSIGFGVVVLSDCHRNRMNANHVRSTLTNVGLAVDDMSGGTGGTACTGNVIDGNTVIGTDIGISVTGSNRNSVVGNTVKSPTNFGILVTPSTDAPNDAVGNVVMGNTVDIDSAVNAFGILVAGSGNRVIGNTVNRGQIGIYVQDTPGASLQTVDTVISKNYLASPSLYGIQIAGGARLAITGNDILSSSDRGITVTAVSPQGTLRGIQIIGNRTKNCQQEGIVVDTNAAAGVQEVVISENLNVDGGQAGSATYASILLAQATSAMSRISIFDNRSVSTTATVWGRNVQITGTVTEYDVVRNLYWGYTPTGADPNTAVAMTVANEATDTTCFPLFVTAATGDLEPKANTGLTFNSNTGALGAVTLASTVATGTAPLTVSSTTKVANLNVDSLDDQSGAYYLDSANFTGTNWTDLTDGGTTTLHTHTSGVASALTVANEATDISCFPVFVTAATGDLGAKSNTGLTFNSSTGALGAVTLASTVATGTAPLTVTSTTKVTNLNADLLDDQSGAYYLDSANFTGTNWTDLTDAGDTTLHQHSAVTVANEAVDTSCFVNFTTAATGNLQPKTNAGLTFNSNTGMFTATGLTGPLTGNASTATALQNARTIGGTSFDGTANIVPSTITIANEATDTSCSIAFFTAATGDLQPKTNANLTFNSNTGVLTSASLVATTADINGGTVDGATIGGSSAGAGTFTTLATTDTTNDNTIAGSMVITGALQAGQTSALALEQISSTTSRIRAYGADAATAGILTINLLATDASPSYVHTFGADGSIAHPGLLDISDTAAGQIKFPGTQNASSDVNTLDDYEEGTFTPGVAFGGGTTGITYTTQVGRYTKIGNRVLYNAWIVLSNKGSSTGAMTVTGLPFTSNATANTYAPQSVFASNLAASATTALLALQDVGTATVLVYRFAAGVRTNLAETDFNNTSIISVSGHYEV